MMGETIPHLAESVELRELVERARTDDRDAFGQLFERYYQFVFDIVLRRVRNVEDARDVTSEVFLQARAELNSLREPMAFAGWIRSIASRMAINSARRADRRKASPLFEPDFEPVKTEWRATTAPEILIRKEHKAAVLTLLSTLDDLSRRALELFYIEGKSLKEMARILSLEENHRVPLGTVQRRLHDARIKFKNVAGPLLDTDAI